MDFETRELLNGIVVYADMMNNINTKFYKLIQENTEKAFHENEQLFYEIISEIIRVLPIHKSKDGKGIVGPNTTSGIMLLHPKITFLLEDYQRIVNNDAYEQILLDISYVRNKFIHEPHNIRATFYVGGKTSSSMGLYYKERLCSVSTIKLTNIIYELNIVFGKLKVFFIEKVDECEDLYKEYPCYKAMMSYDFEKYCTDFGRVPEWMLDEKEIESEL